MKPDWSTAPEWAGWCCMCREGVWMWFENEPTLVKDGRFYSKEGRTEYAVPKAPWINCVEKRPDSVGWQPIETAPKDGTRVEFQNTENGRRDVGYWESWSHKNADFRDLLPDFAKDWDGEWCTDFGEGDMTHWRPIPQPPTSGESAWLAKPENGKERCSYCQGLGFMVENLIEEDSLDYPCPACKKDA